MKRTQPASASLLTLAGHISSYQLSCTHLASQRAGSLLTASTTACTRSMHSAIDEVNMLVQPSDRHTRLTFAHCIPQVSDEVDMRVWPPTEAKPCQAIGVTIAWLSGRCQFSHACCCFFALHPTESTTCATLCYNNQQDSSKVS
jgi:hypothetical protein